MSFRGRLTLFFVLIVVLPTVVVAVRAFQTSEAGPNGKADARLGAGLETGLAVYDERMDAAIAAVQAVARDPALGPALASEDRKRLAAVATASLRSHDLASVVISDPTGDELASAGSGDPLPGARLALRSPGDGPVGSIEVSTTTIEGYLTDVGRLTGREVALLDAGGTPVAATLPVSGTPLPAARHSKDVEVDGQELRAATVSLPAPQASDVVSLSLFTPKGSGGVLGSGPLVVAGLVAFIGVAVVLLMVMLRWLQDYVAAMFRAAQRIGEGDFSQKVPVVGKDDFAGLASEFNKMSERLSGQMDELRRQRDEIERSVQRIGEAFASGLDRDALLQIVVETALEACEAEYGRVVIGDQAIAQASTDGGTAAALREAVKAAEERAERDGGPVHARRGSAHALASTLRTSRTDGGGPLGVMTVAREGDEFSAAEREVFLYLVGQASASIENVALHDLVSAQAVTDELTGLSNNRRFRDWIENEVARAKRFGHELSLLMLDIDDFKQVNDTHGHLQGDDVLRAVARILRAESRGVDEPARYGGEEFVVALPETDTKGAHEVGERIRAKVEAERVPMTEGRRKLKVTASVGVASLPSSAKDVGSLIAAADAALYAAKRAGKNRVEAAPPIKARKRAPRTPRRTQGRASARRK